MLYFVLLIVGALALWAYIREKLRGSTVKAVLMKALVSTLFVCVGIYGAWRASLAGALNPLCPFVLLGLICGLLGDIWLGLKAVFPEKAEPFTYAGFLSFSVGHILYIAGMLTGFFPEGKPLALLLPPLLGAVFSVGNAVLEKPMGLRYGKLKPMVILYGVLLFSMVFYAGALAIAHGWRETALNLFFTGGVLFALSDLILSGTYFGSGRDRPIDLVLNYLTYYPGQFLIASSLFFLI